MTLLPSHLQHFTHCGRDIGDLAMAELGGVDCIFTGNRLVGKAYALDHFIPHAFVSHDLIWNLLPIDAKFNSVKSDKLPILICISMLFCVAEAGV